MFVFFFFFSKNKIPNCKGNEKKSGLYVFTQKQIYEEIKKNRVRIKSKVGLQGTVKCSPDVVPGIPTTGYNRLIKVL